MTNITESKKGRAVVGLAAGAFGIVASLAAAAVGTDTDRNEPGSLELAQSTQEISGNCDEAEHANDPECVGVAVPGRDDTSTTVQGGSTSTSTSTTTPTGTLAPSVRTVAAGDAGSVTVAFDGSQLQLGRTTPNAGWRVEVEQSGGREVEVTFTNGSRRIDVNVELEDGQIRERVRERADDGDGDDVRDDSSGPGPGDDEDGDVDSSGPGSGDDADDQDDNSSGPGSGDDDDDSSGSGSDDD